MAIDTDRIDDCVLALLLLGRHDGCRVWKSFDWDAMDRLHKKGLISDPCRARQIGRPNERRAGESRATVRGIIREKILSGMGSNMQTTCRLAAR